MNTPALCFHRVRFFGGLALLAAVAGCAPQGSSSNLPWMTDYAAAVAQAKREHKKILLDFTGSDWCSWCMKLDHDVYQTPEFAEYSAMDLVLVKVDFPQRTALSAKVEQQNSALQAKYGVQGFPTTILLDANEKILVTLDGYVPGGPKFFIAQLGGHAPDEFLKAFKTKFYARDFAGAIKVCSLAISFDPNNALAYDCRGAAREERHDFAGALADYQRAVEMQPKSLEANDALAWILAVSPNENVRNGAKAVEYATAACKLSQWKSPEALDTLAAALAETGQFADAVKWEKISLGYLREKSALDDANHRLGLYELNFPFREEPK